jgi:hypothetical protein
VHLDGERRRNDEKRCEDGRRDEGESVKHESSFREGFDVPAAEVF